jgi:hypothetical protein
MMYFLTIFVLACIPAMIANAKRRNPVLWWLYGFVLFPIALVHVLLTSDLFRRACPQCAEPVRREALICPHCRSEQPASVTA